MLSPNRTLTADAILSPVFVDYLITWTMGHDKKSRMAGPLVEPG